MRNVLPVLTTPLLALLAAALVTAPAAGARPVAEVATEGLDARAAAAAGGSDIGTEASWSSGIVAAGASQSWVWNNANSALSYLAGFSPTGATSLATCRFEVTRDYYARQPSGELEFRFTIKNVGSISCAANILLAWVANNDFGSTGVLAPGAVYTSGVYFQHDKTVLLSPVPTGASRAQDCQFELTQEYRGTNTSIPPERFVHYTFKNVGSISCQANIRLAFPKQVDTGSNVGTLQPGASITTHWNNASPLNRVYLVDVDVPSGCKIEVTRSYYSQRLNSGIPEREFYFTVKNAGAASCGPVGVLLGYADA